jgi:hypothetical protein
MSGQLAQGLEEHGIGQVVWFQALVVEQARQTFRCRFLVAKSARQLGLTAALLVNNRRDKVAKGFALMPVCSGQHRHDIVVETSSPRVLFS